MAEIVAINWLVRSKAAVVWLGPVLAIKNALWKTDVNMKDIDLIELQEWKWGGDLISIIEENLNNLTY